MGNEKQGAEQDAMTLDYAEVEKHISVDYSKSLKVAHEKFAAIDLGKIIEFLGKICVAYYKAQMVITFIVKYLLFAVPKWKSVIATIQAAITTACGVIPQPPVLTGDVIHDLTLVDDHLATDFSKHLQAAHDKFKGVDVVPLMAKICVAFYAAKPAIDFVVKYMMWWAKDSWKTAITDVENLISTACSFVPQPQQQP